MDYVKDKLKEKCLLFLYVLSFNNKKINVNTLKRYVYLYYLSGKFLEMQMEEITIAIDKGDIKIPFLLNILDDFVRDDFIEIIDNEITICEDLIDKVDEILKKGKGK